MEQLLETYKRRLQAVQDLYNEHNGTKDIKYLVRLATKVSCYKVIIVELEKEIEMKKPNIQMV